MAKKFEDMATGVQDSILRTIEHRLSHGDACDDSKNVESILVAYDSLFKTNTKTTIGEIVVTVSAKVNA